MMRISSPAPRTGATALLAVLGFAAMAAAAEPARTPLCARLAPVTAERAPLDEAAQAVVAEALQDEYHGRSLYGHALEALGDVGPFAHVVHAEERHAALLEELLESRDLSVPPDRGGGDADLPAWPSRREACAAAVEFEVANVALYDRLLADEDLPEDVRQVFEHNRTASLERHKPAFERCAAGGSGRGRGAVVASRGQEGPRGHRRCGRAQAGRCGGCGGSAHGYGGGVGRGRGRGGRGGAGGPRPTAPAPAESGS
jgi:hypothetical protein